MYLHMFFVYWRSKLIYLRSQMIFGLLLYAGSYFFFKVQSASYIMLPK